MKKVINTINKYSIYFLLCLPLILVVLENKSPDNDIWFLLSCGRYVFESGIPTIEPFTIHEGFNYVMQQWLSASIFWGIFNTFGKYGLLTLILSYSIVLFFVYYKLCYILCNNKKYAVILTVLAFSITYRYIVLRPQIFTYLLLLIEILLLELYVKNDNKKYLYGLPILSVLLINLHASMWYMLFVFILPFLCNSIKIKNITIDKINIKPLIFTMLFMIIVGFINPYGYRAMSFIFKSYGIDTINNAIGEMQSPGFGLLYTKIAIFLLFCFCILLWLRKKKTFDIRHILFVLGTYLMFMMHNKCFPYFIIIFVYCVSYSLRFIKVPSKFRFSNIILPIVSGLISGFGISLAFIVIPTSFLLFKYVDFYPAVAFDRDCEIMADYIEENYDLNDVRLYNDFDNGSYYVFRKIKVYIDGRAEVYFKKNNDKKDVFVEFLKIDNVDFDYAKFISEYNFTHLIVYDDSNFAKYLENDSAYVLDFTLYYQEDERQPYQHLYVNKSFVQEVSK